MSIPEEWKAVKLGDITTKIGSGSTPKGGSCSYVDGGIAFIRSQNILDFIFSYNGLVFINEEQAQGLKNVIVQEQDILLNITGDSVARCCNVPKRILPARVNQHVIILRTLKSLLNSQFLKYHLISVKEELLSLSEIGGTRKALTKGMIENISIDLPPLPEQKAIAGVLSVLDDKIDLLHRQNKTLETMAETLFRQWFIEEAQDDWEESDLSQLIQLQSGYAFKSNDFKKDGLNAIIKIKNIFNGLIDINHTDYLSDTINKSILKQFTINSGAILIAMTGANIGKLGILPKTNKILLLNQRVGNLKSNFLGANFIAYLYLKSDFGQDYIKNAATGSAQLNISGSLIEKCPFPLISKELLQVYSLKINNYHQKIQNNLSQIQTLEKLRDTLLPRLMRGEIRVHYENTTS